MKPEISVIVPIYNEEENLPLLAERLSTVMRSTGRSYECLFVDDGSSDRSVEVARSLKNGFPELKIVRLRRNFGQTAALAAGFDSAAGDIIVTLDADLQNDPADIPMLLEKISQGYDLVNGWRKRRRDPWLRVLPSVLANRLISRVTRVRLHDYGCTLKAYR